MATREQRRETGIETTHRYRAFGLDLVSDFRISDLPLTAGERPAASTRLSRLTSPDDLAPWGHPRGEILVDRRQANGRLMMGVDRPNEGGYRVWAPRHGRFVVSADGGAIAAALGRNPARRWQRLLFAQVLPLAAALRGLTAFHASAVALHGKVSAFVASSGTGKTSLALHLVTRGATLVTDDVLALSVTENQVIAHPGAGSVSVFESDLAALDPAERANLSRTIDADDKLQVSLRPVDGPLPLSGVYLLKRDPSVRRIEVTPVVPPDPDLLLGAAFIPYVREPGYLISHLDVCARIAGLVPTFRLRMPVSGGAAHVAAALERHLASPQPRGTC